MTKEHMLKRSISAKTNINGWQLGILFKPSGTTTVQLEQSISEHDVKGKGVNVVTI